MIKINMGCGKRNFGKGWVHIDTERYEHVDYYNITQLHYENDTVDLIYASHVISYFSIIDVYYLLIEWQRVLKNGGILRLAVPDFYQMARLYLNGNEPLSSFLGPLYGEMLSDGKMIYHKMVYDYESLHKLLEVCGFRNIKLWDCRATEHAQFDDHSQAYLPHMDKKNGTLISLNVQCEK